MTTVHQIFTVRSFRSAKDRHFLKALQIYDANIHPQAKTDSREIAHWLHHGATSSDGKFYVCGLFISGTLVGFVEFIYLRQERLIHFDYFVIEPERRTAGTFHIFAEQMRAFFLEENLEWDFITAEVAELDPVNGTSKHAQRLIRLFRQVGFCEVVVNYQQPLLGIEQADTAIKATLLLLPRVEMESISRTRLLELVSGIYRKHYGKWYSIYSATADEYKARIEELFRFFAENLADKEDIELRRPEREFGDGLITSEPPLKGALFYFLKVVVSGLAAAAFHFLLKHQGEFPTLWIIGIPASVFILLVITVSLTDKKRFEAFKLLVSLISKFFDR